MHDFHHDQQDHEHDIDDDFDIELAEAKRREKEKEVQSHRVRIVDYKGEEVGEANSSYESSQSQQDEGGDGDNAQNLLNRQKRRASKGLLIVDTEEQELEEWADTDNIDSLTLIQFDPPYFQEASGLAHLQFQESLTFQSHKVQQMFSYMRRHNRIRCHDRLMAEDELDELLDLIKPPAEVLEEVEDDHTFYGYSRYQFRSGADDIGTWMQRLSRKPSEGEGVNILERKLDFLLERKNAKRWGICQIRRQIYDECLDEVLRQIALDTPERAVLLLRCRLELQHVIKVYEDMFSSIEAFNGCYHTLGQVSQIEIMEKLDKLRTRVDQLKKEKEDESQEFETNRLENAKELEKLKAKYDTELTFLRTYAQKHFAAYDKFVHADKYTVTKQNNESPTETIEKAKKAVTSLASVAKAAIMKTDAEKDKVPQYASQAVSTAISKFKTSSGNAGSKSGSTKTQ